MKLTGIWKQLHGLQHHQLFQGFQQLQLQVNLCQLEKKIPTNEQVVITLKHDDSQTYQDWLLEM